MDKVQMYKEWAAGQKKTYAKLAKSDPIAFTHHFKLTGTMAAPLLGLSKWKTAADLYDEFYSDPRRAPESNRFMRVGSALEKLVIDEYRRITKNETGEGKAFTHHIIPWSAVQVDAWDKDLDCGLEIKTAGLNRRDENGNRPWGEGCTFDSSGEVESTDGQIPIEYVCQVQDQMWHLGTNRHRVCVLFRADCSIKIYELQYDRDLAAKIVRAKEKFLFENLIPHVRPDDGQVYEPLQLGDDRTVAFADQDFKDKLTELVQEKAIIKEHTALAVELEDEIRGRMKDADTVVTDSGEVLCTLTAQKRKIFDGKAFMQEHEDLYKKFVVSKTIKPRLTINMKVKGENEDAE